MVSGADEKIGAGLAGGIGAVRRQWRRLAERGVIGPERAVDLIGGDLNVAGDLRLPGGIEEALGAEHVGPQERRRVVDRPIHVALGREVDDRIEPPLRDKLEDRCPVRDVSLHETVSWVACQVSQIVRVAGVRQGVQVRDRNVRVSLELETHEVGPDEPAASRHQDPFHGKLHVPTHIRKSRVIREREIR